MTEQLTKEQMKILKGKTRKWRLLQTNNKTADKIKPTDS